MRERVNKPFVLLLVIAVAIGIGIGGVFAGGVAFGKSSEEDAPTTLSFGGPGPNSPDGAGQFGQGQGGRAQQGLPQRQPGQFDPSAIGTPTQEPNSGDAGARTFQGRGGVSGTVEKIDGNVVTINTTDGPVEVTIAETTAIGQISEANVDDLQPGIQVTVMGPAGEDGRVEAANVVITPEGLESSFGRGQLRDRGSRRGTGAP